MPFKVETDKYTVISSDPNGDIMTTLDTITQPVLQKTDSSGLSMSLPNNFNVEMILKGSLDSIPSPSTSVKIQIMGGKICLKSKG